MQNKHMALHLFDIEGTIAPVDYVHKTMFPYAEANLDAFLSLNPLSKEMFQLLAAEHESDVNQGLYPGKLTDNYKDISLYLKFLIKIDRKSTVLKNIQGKIWKSGFETNKLTSIIYPDTLEYFKYLKQNNNRIMIYSSGSVEAQKLYLKYSDQGDLSEFVSGNFDTTTGPKKEKSSYEKIMTVTTSVITSANGKKITFYTDIPAEAEAAREAGFAVYLVNRTSEPIETDFPVIESFNSLM